VADLHTTAAARLRADRQRYTGNRRAVVEELARSERPLSIPELLDARSELAQSSVYRTLAVLERAGVVRRLHTSDDFGRYELAEDLTEHHHHLICTRCGVVEDFTVSDSLEADLDRSLRRVASRRGFADAGHRLDIVGTCVNCR
jgi:Fur family ferric uptake transcriptional regulator